MAIKHDPKKSRCAASLAAFFVFFYAISVSPARGGKTPAHAKNGMVVSTSGTASGIGREVLQKGGNAVDAAVATAFALAVTWPSAGNIGGGGFLVYHTGDGAVTTIDFREKAPGAAARDMFLAEDGTIRDNANHSGILAVAVPGTVAGLYKAHTLYGKKSWSELVEPAVKLANQGFKMTWGLFFSLKAPWTEQRLKRDPAAAETFYKKTGQPYQPGEIWCQPDLAESLKRIQKSGHNGFYSGVTAEKLAEFMKKNGGLITLEDLQRYTAVERTSVHGTYRGYDIYSMPPPSSGGIVLIEMLNILEGYDLREMGHNSAQYLHLLTETMRRAYADRARHLGDSDFNPGLPIERLTSKTYATVLRNSIDRSKASKSDPALFNTAFESEQTTHISVVDDQGNAVALTYTLEQSYGSAMVAEDLGFLLNNEMGDFNAIPGLTDRDGTIGTLPNLIEPEKRMLSSMTPAIVAREGNPVLVVGSPGGRTIINTVLQTILNYIDFNMNVAEAIEAGRIHHPWLPDTTTVEAWAISPDTEALYRSMGHEVKYRKFLGRVMGLSIDHENGLISGAADSRSMDGAATGY